MEATSMGQERAMSSSMPGGIDLSLSVVQRLMLLRCLVPAALKVSRATHVTATSLPRH